MQRQAVAKKGGSSKSSQSLHGVIIDQSEIYFPRALFLFNETFYCSSIRNAQQCSIPAPLAFSCPRMQKNGGLLQLVCNIFILVAAKLPATNLRQPDFYRTFSLYFFFIIENYATWLSLHFQFYHVVKSWSETCEASLPGSSTQAGLNGSVRVAYLVSIRSSSSKPFPDQGDQTECCNRQ